MSIHRGLSYEEYCKLPGITASLLKVVDKTTLEHAKAYLDGKMVRESDALDFGHSFHELLLRQQEDFAVHPATYAAPKDHAKVKKGEIAEGDPLDWNANAGICKAWIAEQGGKTIYDETEANSLRSMVAAVHAHKEVRPFLDGDAEIAVTSERRGVPTKSMIDLLPKQNAAPVIDFKKCRSASPRAFVGDAIKLGYHLQAAYYLDILASVGIKRSAFWFVAVEDKPPHGVCVVRFLDEPLSLLRVGRAAYRAAFANLTTAMSTGSWPGWESCEAEDYAPTWMKQQLEQTA